MVVLFVWSSFLILYEWRSNCKISLRKFDTLVCTNAKCGNWGCVSLRKSKIGKPKRIRKWIFFFLNRSIQDLMDHGTLKEPKNPLLGWILQFLWCTMIQEILDKSVSVKKCKIRFAILSGFKNQSWIFLKKHTLNWLSYFTNLSLITN